MYLGFGLLVLVVFFKPFELILHAMLASLITAFIGPLLGVQLNIPGLLRLCIPLAFLLSVS